MFAAALLLLGSVSGCTTESVQADHVYGETPLTDMAVEGAELFALLSAAEDEYIVPCMLREGFEFHSGRGSNTFDSGSVVEVELTLERAQEVGYRQPEYETWDPAMEYVQGLSESARSEFAIALHGTGSETIEVETQFGRLYLSADGCLAEARVATAGSVEQSAQWVAALNNVEFLLADAFHRRDADSLVSEAQTRWSECMGQAGFDVTTLEDAIVLAWSADYAEDGPASAWELLVATTDAGCRQSTGLSDIRSDRQTHYENVILAANEGIILTWQETSEAMRNLLKPNEGHSSDS